MMPMRDLIVQVSPMFLFGVQRSIWKISTMKNKHSSNGTVKDRWETRPNNIQYQIIIKKKKFWRLFTFFIFIRQISVRHSRRFFLKIAQRFLDIGPSGCNFGFWQFKFKISMWFFGKFFEFSKSDFFDMAQKNWNFSKNTKPN